ncbi:MAG TPA: hypothetical protein VN228_18300 [Pyrinomonadaceae bacterium]|nr:hypothetical protein [Pyrinomonadaceae bacterium]
MSITLIRHAFCLAAALFLLAPAAQAKLRQRSANSGPAPALPGTGSRRPDPGVRHIPPGTEPRQRSRPGPFGSPEAELLKRAEIRHEEESHREMVERADETVRLGTDLLDAFGRQKSFSRDDLKRLEKMEKLARKIRGGAGGSDDDEQLEDPPAQLDQAVARLADVSGKLGQSVRKTSRLVVSGAVIKHSNELLELIRHIRAFVKP